MDGELLSILAYFQEQLEEMSAKFKNLRILAIDCMKKMKN